jgi:D-alanyl-D-alanine carboxypeptidase
LKRAKRPTRYLHLGQDVAEYSVSPSEAILNSDIFDIRTDWRLAAVRWTLALAFVVCLPARAHSGDIPERLSAYMDAALKQAKFSGSVLVAKDGKILFAKGYGLANAEHEIPNTLETKFRLGSITKMFTATAILILQDRGKLKVGDPVGKYLPDAPKAWGKVTIHHLLTHTSGVPSYTDDPAYGPSMTKHETVDSMIARFKNKPLEFEPGSKFHYSNSGYFLLGAVIEKLSGKTYEAFLKEAIFEPLGMTDTGYDQPAKVLPKRASGYNRRDDGLINAPYLDMNQPYAAGSLYSTVGDLLKWDRALKEGHFSKGAMAAMFTPFKNNYAYGWSVGERKGHKQLGHGGGINGFATDFQRYPDDGVCVVVLCNVLPANPGRIAGDLAGIAFGESVPLPKAHVVATINAKVYDDYIGKYELDPKFILTITRDGDRLMTQATGQGKIEIFPESETEFFLKVTDAQITFVKEDGKVTHLVLHQNGRDTKAKRVAK